MKLFLSLDLSAQVKNSLNVLAKTLPYFDHSIFSLVPKENYHLTLRFFPNSKPSELISLMDKIQFDSFSFSLEGVGVFPNLENPRVIWIGVAQKQIFRQISSHLDSIFPNDKNSEFIPHVTIARLKKKFALGGWISKNSSFASVPVFAEKVSLYQSVSLSDSVKYDLLSSVNLKKN
jgi:2'-5' RNA ligase